jgi:hypothetical protein
MMPFSLVLLSLAGRSHCPTTSASSSITMSARWSQGKATPATLPFNTGSRPLGSTTALPQQMPAAFGVAAEEHRGKVLYSTGQLEVKAISANARWEPARSYKGPPSVHCVCFLCRAPAASLSVVMFRAMAAIQPAYSASLSARSSTLPPGLTSSQQRLSAPLTMSNGLPL